MEYIKYIPEVMKLDDDDLKRLEKIATFTIGMSDDNDRKKLAVIAAESISNEIIRRVRIGGGRWYI